VRLTATLLALALLLSGAVAGPGQSGAPGAAGATGPAAPGGVTGRPGRVVSINLCTDQLAMMLAAPGQLLSVSHLAAEPRSSSMAEQAGRYRLNHGRAEEVWLMQPDLVIAGSFSSRATVDMLRRLGVPVVEMAPAYALAEVSDRLREMGRALGREAEAARVVRDFEAKLEALRDAPARRPRAAVYDANGFTAGDRTLTGEILSAAGFHNIASEAGVDGIGRLPLELLALADPDAVISGRRHPGASRSEEILDHPVLQALHGGSVGAVLTDRDWVCGTPHVLNAISDMRALRQSVAAE